jgi:hypothetical protein
MSLFTESSLCLVPSGVKDGKVYSIKPTDGSGDLTFSRGSDIEATRVAANGYIEKAKVNLAIQSNSFSTSWSTTNATLTSGQSGYDGSSDAWSLNGSGSNARVDISNTSSGVLTFSVYAKAGTSDFLRLRIDYGAASYNRYFDLSTGTLGSALYAPLDSKIQSVGSGWYRCSITFSESISTLRIYVADVDLGGSASGNIYIQDAQLNYGLVAQEYQETTTTSVVAGITNDMPRLDYSGGASCPSLLLEPSRQNLFPQSEWSGGWTIENATADYNNATSPEGVQNAVLLTANGGNQDHTTYVETTSLSPNTYSYSVFIKKGTQRYVHLTLNERFVDSSWITATFDLDELTSADHSSGTGYVDGTSDIIDYGNDWYRLQMTGALVNTTTYLVFVGWANGLGAPNTSRGRYNVTTSNTFYAYGAQLEVGSYPTSYIPTYGTSATRTVDACSKTGISSVFNDSEGVFFAEMSALDDSGTKVITISDGTTSNRVQLYYFGNVIRGSVAGQAVISHTITPTDTIKVAFKYKVNDFALWVDGVEVGTDTLGSAPSGLNKISFDNGASSSFFEGNIKQLIYFPTALSDSDLATLTA